MRLPFPEKLPLVPVFYFAVILCAIQQLQGTNSTFSLLSFFYILAAAIAFNIAGGFTRTTGSFIFFNSILGAILGLCVKAYLGESADSNLQSPILTMSVYLFGMCMMMLAAYLSRKVVPRQALLGKMVTDANMQTATVGSMVIGVLITFAGYVLPNGNGTVFSALNQLNRFVPLAIFLGVLNTIRRSGGTRSTNLPVLISGAFLVTNGILGYSKETMIAPFVCWLLAAASQRFNMSRSQLVGGAIVTFLIFYYLVPYSQYGRVFKEESGAVNIQTSLSLLTNIGEVRKDYFESAQDATDERIQGWFDNPEGFFDRLQMVSIDDAIINHTKLFGTFGGYPVIQSFENVVPHFIWPNKPALLSGNVYAHEVGLLAEGDESTGVSFSSTAIAYHLLGWFGVFLLAPALWFLLFTVFDSLCGDTRKSPWGLIVLVLYSHAAPEGDINHIIYMIFFSAFGVIFAAVIGAYVTPIVGTFLIGPEGIMLRTAPRIRSVPRPRLVEEPSEG
ncbi:hypothetical protein [Tunturiibacter lichenicola]|uniref:hypothetical protein n=1 Tax=Tunturiibacter lichenicola TaxID=2051959 RepID=UPI0021B3561A|nr:hypothetical protein [Edaphobacter lichenicola]